jgi:ATP synthase protein I
MQANDVRLLKSAAIPALAVGLLVAAVATFLAGTAGLLGAVIGLLVVTVFFVVGIVAVSYASRISPTMMMAAAMGTFFAKILILAVVLSSLSDVTVWRPAAFTWSVILCTVAWTIGEARGFLKLRMLYVEPGTKVPGSVGER